MEEALIGWQAIAKMFGVSVQTAIKRKNYWLENGIIFYQHHGRPPRRQVCAFPSQLMRMTMIKASQGETI